MRNVRKASRLRSRLATAWAGLLLLAGTIAQPVNAESFHARLADVLADLSPGAIPSGILYDRVLPMSGIERYDGRPGAPAIRSVEWRRLAEELHGASLGPAMVPAPAEILTRAREERQRGTVSIVVADFFYERIRPDALESGALLRRAGRLELGSGDAFSSQRVFAAAALNDRTYHGASVQFRLHAHDWFTNLASAPSEVLIDFADGRGFRSVVLGALQTVEYRDAGAKIIRLRASTGRGPVAAAFRFDVLALRTPPPDDTLHIQASIPYQGGAGTGSGYVYLAPEHTQLTEPVIVIEGFDLDNSMGWDELYELLNREELLETLRADGFDAVVLNFTDSVDYLQRNTFVAIELIQQVQAMVAPEKTIALAGASMGGVIGRYALAYMETHAMAHRVRTFVSFDSPHAGADVPLGIQYWLWFFADDSAEAAALLAALDAPGARQLLLYHYTDPPTGSGQSDPLRAQLLADIAAAGDYPQNPRLVALANGSAAQTDQGFSAGAQVILWEYTSFLVDITGNVWAVPDETSHLIFHGLIDIIFLPEDEVTVSVATTRPLDNAPGGWRGSMAQLDTTEAPYGDIIALHPNHCFVPTISALALDTADLFYDIAGDPNILAHTPFDAVYFPLINEEHVEITPTNKAILIEEIEDGATSVSEREIVGPVVRIGPPAPNPATDTVRLRCALPSGHEARIVVLDSEGRERAVIAAGRPAATSWAIDWNGCDSHGKRLNPGVYFICLQGDNFAATRKLILR